MKAQEIKCNVHTCKHNDKVKFCTLPDITVGSTQNEARQMHDTECVSFEM